MPIMPQSMHVIVLYGRKACEQLSPMVHYYQRALADGAWGQIGWVSATAGNQEPDGWSDIPGASLKAHAVMRENHCMTLDQNTINDIQRRCNKGTVTFHFVCDDFETQEMDNQSVPQLIKDLNEYFYNVGVTSVNAYVYMFLHTDFDKIAAQRDFLSALKELGSASVYPYFISQLLENGSRCEPWLTQRAVMCEILAIMDGRARASVKGDVYSLGYASLNANDGELHACRWRALLDAFDKACRVPISNFSAWNMLTGSGLTAYDPHQMPHYVTDWLKELAKYQMNRAFERLFQMSNAAFDNLQQLIDLNALPVEDIQKAVAQFYQLNFTYVLTQVPDDVEKRIKHFFDQLSSRPNAASFPDELLNGLFAELQKIVSADLELPVLQLPQRSKVELPGRYRKRCFDACNRYYREASEATLVYEYAKHFRATIQRIRDYLSRAGGIFPFIQQMVKKETAQLPSNEKYPSYITEIQNTLNGYSLFLNEDPLFDPSTGDPLEKQIHLLLAKEDEQLHQKMPAGYNGTFIQAIRAVFNTPNTMNQFLDNYLVCNHRMFYSPHESIGNYTTVLYVDNDLQIPSSPQVVQCVIDNDNAEKLNRYTLKNKLGFYLESDMQGKPYFTLANTQPLFPQSAPAPQKVEAPEVKERSDAVDTSATLRQAFDPKLTVTSKFFLNWNWEPGLNSVSVQLNNQPPKIISVTQYSMSNGFSIARNINSGANYVKITRSDNTFYAELTFPGKPLPLQYNIKSEGNNSVSLLVQNLGSDVIRRMVLCETKGNFSIYYPMCAPAAPHSNLYVYKNLRFSGSISLITDPRERSDPFNPIPVYQGVQVFSF